MLAYQRKNDFIKERTSDYIVGMSAKECTSARYVKEGQKAASASEDAARYSELIQNAEAEAKFCLLPENVAKVLFIFWCALFLANAWLTYMVLKSYFVNTAAAATITGVMFTSGLVLLARVVVRSVAVAEWKAGISHIVALAAIGCALVIMGVFLTGNADARASYLYDDQIDGARLKAEQLRADQLRATGAPDEFEIKLWEAREQTLEASKAKAAAANKFFIPLTFMGECVTAFFLYDAWLFGKIRKLRRKLRKFQRKLTKAESAQRGMESSVRNRIIGKLVEMGIFTRGILPEMGLQTESQEETTSTQLAPPPPSEDMPPPFDAASDEVDEGSEGAEIYTNTVLADARLN